MICKDCGRPAPSNMQGYCQACYLYFVREKKVIYPTPSYGKITYAPVAKAFDLECYSMEEAMAE